jgi:hypothetical protein
VERQTGDRFVRRTSTSRAATAQKGQRPWRSRRVAIASILSAVSSIVYVRKLGENKELHPQTSTPTAVGRLGVGTQIVPQAGRAQIVHQLWQRPHQAQQTKETERGIPNGECIAPVPAGARAKVGLAAENGGSVGETSDNGNPTLLGHPCEGRYGVVVGLPAVCACVCV